MERITQLRVKPTVVLQSQVQLSLEDLIASVVFSNIDRKKDGIISLFLCHISPSCLCPELMLYKDATRIDIDYVNNKLLLWFLEYSTKPNVVIKNILQGA